jgi:hypothetical protein
MKIMLIKKIQIFDTSPQSPNPKKQIHKKNQIDFSKPL